MSKPTKRAVKSETLDIEDAVLSCLLGTPVPQLAPLAPDTVPTSALDPLVDAIAYGLARVQRPSTKAKVTAVRRGVPAGAMKIPHELAPFGALSERGASRAPMRAAIWQALWRDRDNAFMTAMIDGWAKGHTEAIRLCESGEIDDPDCVLRILQGTEGSSLTDAVVSLWITGTELPRRARTFQLLAAVQEARMAQQECTTELARLRGRETILQDQLEAAQGRHKQDKEELQRQKDELRTARHSATTAIARANHLGAANAELKTRARALEKENQDRWDLFQSAQEAVEATDVKLQELRARGDNAIAERDELRGLLAQREREMSGLREEAHKQRSRLRGLARQVQQFEEASSVSSAAKSAWALIEAEHDRAEVETGIATTANARSVARERHSAIRALSKAFLEVFPEHRPGVPEPPRCELRFTGLGGATEIGASAYVIELAGSRVLVDCGVRVGSPLEDMPPDIEGVGPIDAVVLTHAHADHIGWLPALLKSCPGDYEIIASPATADLLPIMLNDSLLQVTRMLEEDQTIYDWTHDNGFEPAPSAPYTEQDLEQVLARVRPITTDETVRVGNATICLRSAGHILGASSVVIDGGGRRVVVSGDMATFDQLTVPGADSLDDLGSVDLLVLESTYGQADHPSRERESKRLTERVGDVIARGGVALLPCFALGRAQEVLAILDAAMQAGDLPRCPVWIDGLVRKVNRVYQEYGLCDLADNFVHVSGVGNRSREAVTRRATKEACVIVTTSGMMTGGPVVGYAEALLDNPNNRLFFTGYLDEDSPGRRIVRMMDEFGRSAPITVRDQDGRLVSIKPKSAPVKVQLSAHSDGTQLVELCGRLRPQHIVLVHGDDDAREALRQRLSAQGLSVSPSSEAFSLPST